MSVQINFKREKLNHNLHIMITSKERERLESEAIKRGLSVAAFMRTAATEKINRDSITAPQN